MRHVLLALAALPALAPAQTPPPPASPATQQGSDVVVTARPEIRRKEAKQFAQAASAPVENQLPRFARPACPMAIGFSPALAARIVERMRDVIDAARAPLAPMGCKGNMVVLAAPDGGGTTLREMKRLDTPLIHGLQGGELDRLIRAPGPVWSWTLTQIRNEDGVEPYAPINETPTLDVQQDWLLAPGGEQTIQLAVVLIDWPAMMGKSATQIADYAAMRTLARTRPVGGSGPVGTILALFDPAATPPTTMTPADLAYLKALYGSSRPRYARAAVDEAAHGIRTASAPIRPPAPALPIPRR